MANDEEQQRRSRVVVDTPTSRREVVQTESSRVPDRSGISTGTAAALVIGALALIAILYFAVFNKQPDDANANVHTTTTTTTAATTAPTAPPPTTIIQQPAPQQAQPPVIIQAPAQSAPPPTIIVPPSSATAPSTTTSATGNPSSSRAAAGITDDVTAQANVDRKLQDDPTLSTLGITAIVNRGKATLTGTVDSPALKRQVEKTVRTVAGVRSVDNQIAVSGSSGNIN